jgi:hypothetical protein
VPETFVRHPAGRTGLNANVSMDLESALLSLREHALRACIVTSAGLNQRNWLSLLPRRLYPLNTSFFAS